MSFIHYVGSHGFHSPTQRVSRVGDDVVEYEKSAYSGYDTKVTRIGDEPVVTSADKIKSIGEKLVKYSWFGNIIQIGDEKVNCSWSGHIYSIGDKSVVYEIYSHKNSARECVANIMLIAFVVFNIFGSYYLSIKRA